jgi:hypothetical protein
MRQRTWMVYLSIMMIRAGLDVIMALPGAYPNRYGVAGDTVVGPPSGLQAQRPLLGNSE